MAKAAKEKDKGGHSTLDAAFKALQAGDAVEARRLARQVFADPAPQDDQAAPKLAKQLLAPENDEGPSDKLAGPWKTALRRRLGGNSTNVPPDPTARVLAAQIIARTQPVLRPYLWALGGALAYGLLLTLALVRYG